MPKPTAKLYVYVDETGQDTSGRLFLILAVVFESEQRFSLDDQLVDIERVSKKGTTKWHAATSERRQKYLARLPVILRIIGPVYWRQWQAGTSYIERMGEAVVAAVRHKDPLQHAELFIVLDGFNWQELTVVKGIFRSHHVRWRKIVGGREESSPGLRLADSLVGFLRDVHEGHPHSQDNWRTLQRYFHEL